MSNRTKRTRLYWILQVAQWTSMLGIFVIVDADFFSWEWIFAIVCLVILSSTNYYEGIIYGKND